MLVTEQRLTAQQTGLQLAPWLAARVHFPAIRAVALVLEQGLRG
jgi:hypothetical protein